MSELAPLISDLALILICPAHRPLVQTNKLAKAKLAAWRKAQSEKLDAKKEAVK